MLYRNMENIKAKRTATIQRRASRYETMEDSEQIGNRKAVNPERDYARIMTRQEI